MDDDTQPIRAVIARSFALLAASVHAADPEDQIDIARDYEHFIMTGEDPPEIFAPETLTMLNGFCMMSRAKRATDSRKG